MLRSSPWAPLVVLGVASLATAQQSAPLTTSDVQAFADEAFARYLCEYDEPCLALAVVKGDSVLFMKGYGTEDPERHRPVDPAETLFNIASGSKLMVASAVLSTRAHGLRLALTVGLTLLLAGAAVGLALVPLCMRVWRGRYWGAARQVHFTALAAGELLAVPLLWRYHLLGYWFG